MTPVDTECALSASGLTSDNCPLPQLVIDRRERALNPDPRLMHELLRRWPLASVKPAPTGRFGSWHLPRGKKIPDLCAALDTSGADYVLVPAAVGTSGQVPALFIADRHVDKLSDFIKRTPFGQPLAVYSPTGLPGFSYQQHWRLNSDMTSMAVIPAHLADAMLSSAERGVDGCRRLPSQILLLWEIYRSLFLNGDSGFQIDTAKSEPILTGPKARTILDLAEKTGQPFEQPLILSSLHRYLADRDWIPPLDVLRRISPGNSWASLKVSQWQAERHNEEPGLVAFFVRRAVFEFGMEEGIASIIDTGGFEILKTIDLDDDQVASTAREVRGGNWGPGSFSVDGGPPMRVIIAYDVSAVPVTDAMLVKYPQLDNAHILEAKLRCREYIRDRLPRNRQFNPVHSTDDSIHAWDVVRRFAPQDEASLRETMRSRKAEFETEHEVLRCLTRTGLRAKIELIRYGEGVAVKKTFRHNCLRFMEREISFMNAVSSERREIPPVLERGPNYLIMPYIEGRPLRRFLFGRGFPALMSLKQVREMADLLRFLFAKGYDPIDLGPHNLLVDRSGQVRAIDFEFVHWNGKPVDPNRAACLHGIPQDFVGEWPPKALWCPQRAKSVDPWRFRWFACTGLSVDSFLHDPPALQRVKRSVNYPLHLAKSALQLQRRWLRRSVTQILKQRIPVFTRVARGALRIRRT